MTSGNLDIASSEFPIVGESARPETDRVVTIRGILWLIILGSLFVAALAWLRTDPRQRALFALNAASRLILDSAVVEVDPSVLVQSGADGLMSVLDPYSSYLSTGEYDSFLEDTEGEYVGIGIEISPRDGQTVVYNVFPQSPAAEAFIRPGDHIVSIDGEPTAGRRAAQNIQKMKGPAGTTLKLVVERPGREKRSVTLVRRKVDVDVFPIVGVTQSGVAYVRWTQFTAGSGDHLAAIIEDLLVDRPIGLVIDLRGNPGGILEEAVTAAGIFLPIGSHVCTLAGRGTAGATDYVTTTVPSAFQGPVVLVQDGSTASASEIFIAALRDAGRAPVVGRRSFGKGWVQTVTPLGDMGALKLSTARYRTPSGQLVGNPRQSREQYDSILAGYDPEGAGLPADLIIPAPTVGPWEEALLQTGTFADYVAMNSDEWPAAGVEDSVALLMGLRRLCDSAGINPSGPEQRLFDQIGDTIPALPWESGLKALLSETLRKDRDLLFSRELRPFLRHLWEERLMTSSDVDPGELEALMEFDHDLAVSRDLVEQPERYRLMLENSQAKRGATAAAP